MKVVFYLLLCFVGTININPIEPEPTFSLVVFEGSDWCTNCIKLQHNILSKTQFTDYLKENNITLDRIDFPRWTKQSKETIKRNNTMAEQYNFQGDFPTIILTASNSSDYIQIAHHNKTSVLEITDQIQTHLLSNSK